MVIERMMRGLVVWVVPIYQSPIIQKEKCGAVRAVAICTLTMRSYTCTFIASQILSVYSYVIH